MRHSLLAVAAWISSLPHLKLAAHRPWPVRNRLSMDHMRRGRSKPGGQTDGTTMRERLITSVVDHSSLHADVSIIIIGLTSFFHAGTGWIGQHK